MPSYEHQCQSEDCKFEFEDFYSITKDPPTTCPKCGQETVKRLIADNSSRGIVELTGEDLKAKVREDAGKLKKEVYSSERAYSNFIGESKYETAQRSLEKNRKR